MTSLAMTKTEEFSPSLEGVMSTRPEVQLGSLRAIKDSIVGQPQRKALYLKQNLLRTLFELLKEPSVSPDAKLEATIILGSLCYGILLPQYIISSINLYCLGSPLDQGAFIFVTHTNLVITLAEFLDPDIHSPRQIIAALRTLNTFYEFNPVPNPPGLSYRFYQVLIRIFQLHRKPVPRSIMIEEVELAAQLVERSFGTLGPIDEFAELDILDAMLSFMYGFVFASWDLQKDYAFNKAPPAISSRLLPNLLFAIGALIKDDQARATQVANAKPSAPLGGATFEDEFSMLRILLRLTKNSYGPIKLGAVECLTYMFRGGAIGGKEVGDINNLVVPILVRLFDDIPEVRMRAPQILGNTLCRYWLMKRTFGHG